MRTLTVPLPGREYDILIRPGLLPQAGGYLCSVVPQARKVALVTDSHVAPLYGETVAHSLARAGFQVETFVVPAGEQSKCSKQLARLWSSFAQFSLTRTDCVVALGGGVVGDLAGFAAATILRGVALIQIPTTLLAQVDSSVGGKVAIDLPEGKNLAGTFYQPRLVLMDPEVLGTLPHETFADGMAEVIKYGCIADQGFLEFLSQNPSRSAIMANMEQVLYTCCRIKAEVVAEDELDTGRRMILNFGHTLGHAYELAGHYTTYTHGQAVAAGMVRAAQLGTALGLTPAHLAPDIAQLVEAFGLPTAIPCSQADYAAAIGLDKKGAGSSLSLILLDRPGHALAYPILKQQLLEML